MYRGGGGGLRCRNIRDDDEEADMAMARSSSSPSSSIADSDTTLASSSSSFGSIISSAIYCRITNLVEKILHLGSAVIRPAACGVFPFREP